MLLYQIYANLTSISLLFLLPNAAAAAAPESCWATDLGRPPRLPNEVAVTAGVVHGGGRGWSPPAAAAAVAVVVGVWARKRFLLQIQSCVETFLQQINFPGTKFRESPSKCSAANPKIALRHNISASHSRNLMGMVLHYSEQCLSKNMIPDYRTIA